MTRGFKTQHEKHKKKKQKKPLKTHEKHVQRYSTGRTEENFKTVILSLSELKNDQKAFPKHKT